MSDDALLAELTERLEKAVYRLDDAAAKEGAVNVSDHLRSKAGGVRLALSYVRDTNTERRDRPNDH
jgi:hypothetical protein